MASNSDPEEYTVEDILAEKQVDGVFHYLVKWEGYDEDR